MGLSAPLRLEAARRIVQSDPFISVATWEAMYPGRRWPDFPEVIASLQAQPNIGASTRVFYVCGTDHAKKCGLLRGGRGFGVVVVPRAGDAAPPEVAGQRDVFVAEPVEGSASAFSSTRVRAALSSRDEAAVAAMLGQGAAALLLRPSPQEHAAFKRDYAKLKVELGG